MDNVVRSKTMAAALRRKNIKKGLNFSLMLVGASGLGKSTFVNTLVESSLIPKRETEGARVGQERTLQITPHNIEIEEDGKRLSLTIIDTPGFGDNVNSELHFQQILSYIESKYDEVLSEETRIRRDPKFQDDRVHCILYFINPSGHSLRELDIDLMRKLSHRVNLIPVIGKSDSFTKDELREFKKRVMEDLEFYKIPIYDFPFDADMDEEIVIEANKELRLMLPFAVVGCEEELVINGRRVRCRQYPWGVVEVDNTAHSDFSRLRYLLFNSHTTEFKDITHDILYEQFRTERLSSGDFDATQMERSTSVVSQSSDGMRRQQSNF